MAPLTKKRIAAAIKKLSPRARRLWAECAEYTRTGDITDPLLYPLIYYRRSSNSIRNELDAAKLIEANGVFTELGCAVAKRLVADAATPTPTDAPEDGGAG